MQSAGQCDVGIPDPLAAGILDGDERRITLHGPGELEAALTSVSAVLSFKAGVYALPEGDDAVQSENEPSET